MNERIKELAEQSGILRQIAQWSWEFGNCNVDEDCKELENFYKLIVQECADFIREKYNGIDAENLAWMMEVNFELHKDYGE